MIEAVLFASTIALVWVCLRVFTNRAKGHPGQMNQAALRVGLSHFSSDGIAGEVFGVQVRAKEVYGGHGLGSGPKTEVTALVPGFLGTSFQCITEPPVGSSISTDRSSEVRTNATLDAKFLTRGADGNAIRQLIVGEEVARCLLDLDGEGFTLDMDQSRVRVYAPESIDELTRRHIELAATLAVSLTRTWNQHWEQFAQENRLQVQKGGRRMVGRFNGYYLDIEEQLVGDTTRTKLTVDLPARLPAGTFISHIKNAHADASPYREDMPDFFAHASTPNALNHTLAFPGILDAFQSYLTRFPDSILLEDRLITRIGGKPTDLYNILNDASAVMKLINRARGGELDAGKEDDSSAGLPIPEVA